MCPPPFPKQQLTGSNEFPGDEPHANDDRSITSNQTDPDDESLPSLPDLETIEPQPLVPPNDNTTVNQIRAELLILQTRRSQQQNPTLHRSTECSTTSLSSLPDLESNSLPNDLPNLETNFMPSDNVLADQIRAELRDPQVLRSRQRNSPL